MLFQAQFETVSTSHYLRALECTSVHTRARGSRLVHQCVLFLRQWRSDKKLHNSIVPAAHRFSALVITISRSISPNEVPFATHSIFPSGLFFSQLMLLDYSTRATGPEIARRKRFAKLAWMMEVVMEASGQAHHALD